MDAAHTNSTTAGTRLERGGTRLRRLFGVPLLGDAQALADLEIGWIVPDDDPVLGVNLRPTTRFTEQRLGHTVAGYRHLIRLRTALPSNRTGTAVA